MKEFTIDGHDLCDWITAMKNTTNWNFPDKDKINLLTDALNIQDENSRKIVIKLIGHYHDLETFFICVCRILKEFNVLNVKIEE